LACFSSDFWAQFKGRIVSFSLEKQHSKRPTMKLNMFIENSPKKSPNERTEF